MQTSGSALHFKFHFSITIGDDRIGILGKQAVYFLPSHKLPINLLCPGWYGLIDFLLLRHQSAPYYYQYFACNNEQNPSPPF